MTARGWTMRRVDHEALERAVIAARKLNAHLEARLDEDWEEAAKFAASLCQTSTMGLKTHQLPPADIDVDEIDAILDAGRGHPFYAAAQFLERMVQNKISQFEPDPVAALRRAERALAS